MNSMPRLILVLTLITAGAGLILSLVELVTREPIAEQRRLETLRALKAVLPQANNSPDEDTVQLVTGKDKRGRDVQRTFFRGKQDGALSGVAFKVVAPDGYSGNIDIMVGIDPSGTIAGIEILSHAETPGLGDKIFKDQDFVDQFFARPQTPLAAIKAGSGKGAPGEIDAITGATISSKVVVSIINNGIAEWRPILEKGIPEEAQ